MARITIQIDSVIDPNIQSALKEIVDVSNKATESVSKLSQALGEIGSKTFSKILDSVKESNKVYNDNALALAKIELAQTKANTALINSSTARQKLNQEELKAEQQKIRLVNLENQQALAIERKTNKLIKEQEALIASSRATALANLRSSASQLVVTAPEISAKGARELEKLNREFNNLNGSSARAGSSLLLFSNIFRAYIAIRGSNEVIKIVDSYTLMQNRLKLVTSTMEETRSVQAEMFETANNARAGVDDLTRSYVRFDYALKGLGATQQESLRFTTTLSKQLAISGLTTTEQSSALLQLSQALNKGKLDGDEFRTVMETLPTLATAIARQMGVARGELIKLAPQGKITAQVIRDAMASIANDTDTAFRNLTPTIGQALTVGSNKVIELTGKFNEMTGISGVIADSIIFLTKNVYLLGEALVFTTGIMLIKFLPAIISAFETIQIYGLYLLANPLFAIGAVIASATLAFSYFVVKQNRANDELDASNERKRIQYEELRKSQKKNLDFMVYETDATIKLAKETREYTELILLNKKAREKGFISKEQETQQEQETPLGKSRKSANDLISKTDNDFKTNADKRRERLNQVEQDYVKEIALAQNFQKALLNLADEGLKKRIQKENVLKSAIAKSLAPDTPSETLGKVINPNFRKGIEEFNITNAENDLNKFIESQKELNIELEKQNKLVDDLKDARSREESLLRNADILRIMTKITNDLDDVQNEYNATLVATEKLKNNGIINAGQEALLIKDTTKAKNDLALQDNIYNAKFHTNSEKRIREIKRETDSVLLLIEANRKKTDSILEFDLINSQQESVKSNSNKQIEEINRLDIKAGKFGTDTSQLNGSKAHSDAIEAQNQAYKEQIQNAKARDAEIYANYLQHNKALLGVTKARTDQEDAVNEADKEKRRQIDSAYASAQLNLAANTFGSLKGLADQFAQGKTAGARRAYEITKALSYAEAVLHMASAIAAANTEKNIYIRAVAIGTAIAVGATQIAAIKNAPPPKFRDGGLFRGAGTTTSDANLIRVSDREFIVNARDTERNLPALNRINNGGKADIPQPIYTSGTGSNGGGKMTVNHNIYNTAGVSVETTSSKNENGDMDINVYVKKIGEKLASDYSQGKGPLTAVIKQNISRKY